MSIKILHTADNHLDPVLTRYKHKVDERRYDFWRCFKQVLDYAIERKPDLFIIAGDLFDKVNPRNPPRTQLMKYFRKMYNEGIRTFIVGGHHDVPRSMEEGASPIDELAASGYVTFFSNRKRADALHLHINNMDICVSGTTYDFSLKSGSDPLQTIKIPIEGDINIFITHYAIEGFNIPRVYAIDPMIRLYSIPKGLTYLAAGHLHTHQEKIIGETLIAYPGSTERKSFLEEGDERKGFLWLELNEKGILSKKFIELPARKMKTIKLNIEGVKENPVDYIIKEAIKYRNKDLIFRIQVVGNVDIDALAKYRRDEVLLNLIDKFFIVFVDDTKLRFRGVSDIGHIELKTPIEAFLNYIENLIRNSSDEEEKKILKRAKEIGESYLREVGGW